MRMLCFTLMLLALSSASLAQSLSARGHSSEKIENLRATNAILKSQLEAARRIVQSARRCGDQGLLYLAGYGADGCASVELLRGLEGPEGAAGPAGAQGSQGPDGPPCQVTVCCGQCEYPAEEIR